MAIIKAPNRDYTGVSAGVRFEKGEGRTDNRHLIEWFRAHGYAVELPVAPAQPGGKKETDQEPEQEEAVAPAQLKSGKAKAEKPARKRSARKG